MGMIKHFSPRSLVLLLLASLVSTAAADGTESWPRFRGPNGQGISQATQLPVRWTDSNIRWKTPLPGKGHSSPVIWKDRLYLTSGDNQTGDRYVICLGISDGAPLWQKKFSSTVFPQNRDNSFGSSTPAVDDLGVYVYWTTPEATAVAALTHQGEEKWIKNLGPFMGKHGSGASLVVLDHLVWVNHDHDGPSALIALEAGSGAIKFKIDRQSDKVSYGTPCLLTRPGQPDQLIFAASSHGLTSVNPRHGTVNWDLTGLFKARVVSSPITSDDLIICSSGEGGVGRRLVAVRPPFGQNPATIVYDFKSGIPNVPTPLAKDGRLYLLCDNGLVRCLRAQTGEALWQERLPEPFYASPVWAQDRLYCVSKNGTVFVLAAADQYQLLAQNNLGEPSFATPAIARNTLFFRTTSQLLAVGGQ